MLLACICVVIGCQTNCCGFHTETNFLGCVLYYFFIIIALSANMCTIDKQSVTYL